MIEGGPDKASIVDQPLDDKEDKDETAQSEKDLAKQHKMEANQKALMVKGEVKDLQEQAKDLKKDAKMEKEYTDLNNTLVDNPKKVERVSQRFLQKLGDYFDQHEGTASDMLSNVLLAKQKEGISTGDKRQIEKLEAMITEGGYATLPEDAKKNENIEKTEPEKANEITEKTNENARILAGEAVDKKDQA